MHEIRVAQIQAVGDAAQFNFAVAADELERDFLAAIADRKVDFAKTASTEKLQKLQGGAGFTGNAPGGPSRWSTERSTQWVPLEPKLVVVMGEDALEFLNGAGFPLSQQLTWTLGELQRFTPTIEALVVPDIDLSLDEAPAKTAFWNAFKAVGPWWAELPPY